MQRVFSANSILLSTREVEAFMKRYGDDMGFNYWKFLQDIDDVQFCEAKHEEIMRLLKIINEQKPEPCSKAGFSIVNVFGKVKAQIIRNRINFDQFLTSKEAIKEPFVSESKFRMAFGAAGIILEDCELDILCKSFECRCNPGFVDHIKFCKLINEAFYQTQLEKQPKVQPIQCLPTYDDPLNFLDLDERRYVSFTLQKLSRHHEDVTNMKSFFKERAGCGDFISRENFKQVLKILGLMELVTEKELDIVFKCFAKPSGKGSKFDYQNFLIVLSRINEMRG